MYNYETTPITDKYKILAAQLATQIVAAEIQTQGIDATMSMRDFNKHAGVIYQWLTKDISK